MRELLEPFLGIWKVDVDKGTKNAPRSSTSVETLEQLYQQAPLEIKAELLRSLSTVRQQQKAMNNSFVEIGEEIITISTNVVSVFHVMNWKVTGRKAVAEVSAVGGSAYSGNLSLSLQDEALKLSLGKGATLRCRRSSGG